MTTALNFPEYIKPSPECNKLNQAQIQHDNTVPLELKQWRMVSQFMVSGMSGMFKLIPLGIVLQMCFGHPFFDGFPSYPSFKDTGNGSSFSSSTNRKQEAGSSRHCWEVLHLDDNSTQGGEREKGRERGRETEKCQVIL